MKLLYSFWITELVALTSTVYADISTPRYLRSTDGSELAEDSSEAIDGTLSRMVAFVDNTADCPTDAQIADYTHIVVGPTGPYEFDDDGNKQCFDSCAVPEPSSLCLGDTNPRDLIQKWQAMNKKVLISFGGPEMGLTGGSPKSACWEECFDYRYGHGRAPGFSREGALVERLQELADAMHVDGINIDFRYFDKQYDEWYNRDPEEFLMDLTHNLRKKLPDGTELTHTIPRHSINRGYDDVLEQVFDDLDFIIPQFYTKKKAADSAVKKYINRYGDFSEAINLECFNKDHTKIVYGLSSDLAIDDALDQMEKLSKEYPGNGGASVWNINNVEKEWSQALREQLDTTSSPPSCEDDDNFYLNILNVLNVTCELVSENTDAYCNDMDHGHDQRSIWNRCRKACGRCDSNEYPTLSRTTGCRHNPFDGDIEFMMDIYKYYTRGDEYSTYWEHQ